MTGARGRPVAGRLLGRGLLAGAVFLSLLGPPLSAQAGSPILALPQGGATPVGEQEITRTPKGIRIQVQERALRDVLQRLQNDSGIQFEVSSALMEVPLTATIEAPDWPAAIRQLLREFGRAEVQDEEQRLRRVLVLGRGQESAVPPIKSTYVPPVKVQRPEGSPTDNEDPGTTEAPPGVSLTHTPSPGPPVGQGAAVDFPPPDERTQPYEPGPDPGLPGEDGPPGE